MAFVNQKMAEVPKQLVLSFRGILFMVIINSLIKQSFIEYLLCACLSEIHCLARKLVEISLVWYSVRSTLAFGACGEGRGGFCLCGSGKQGRHFVS